MVEAGAGEGVARIGTQLDERTRDKTRDRNLSLYI
jgi:hypothetical protein